MMGIERPAALLLASLPGYLTAISRHSGRDDGAASLTLAQFFVFAFRVAGKAIAA